MSYEAWGEPDDCPFEAAAEAGWLDPIDISQATMDVMNERSRQWDDEGWEPSHDDQHIDGSLAAAAACYANPVEITLNGEGVQFTSPDPETEDHKANLPIGWPESWDADWWKPSERRRDLVKAGALILAEIERLDRLTAKQK